MHGHSFGDMTGSSGWEISVGYSFLSNRFLAFGRLSIYAESSAPIGCEHEISGELLYSAQSPPSLLPGKSKLCCARQPQSTK
jgi:hypothetical protein